MPTSDTLIWLRHRDPRRLWPKLIALTVLLHGLLWLLGWPIWLRSQPAVAPVSQTVVPIELIDPSANPGSEFSSENITAAPASEETPRTPTAATPSQPNSGSPSQTDSPGSTDSRDPAPSNTPDPDPSGQSQPADSSDSSENNSDSDSQNNSADADDPDSDETGNSNTTGTSGTGNTDNTNNQASNSSDPPSGSQGADDGFGTANVSGDAPGQNPSFTAQLSTLQVQQNADDIPDRVPTLVNLGPQLIVLDPLQATCEASPEALRTIQSGVAVELRITVEADGRVSDALVTNTSASFDFDSLILCLLVDAQKFEFTPAQSDGQAVPTDQVILTVTVTPS